jgi:hypothetical protein
MNPSICRLNGELLVLVRAVNYRIRDDGSYDFDGVVRTRNLLGSLGPDGHVRAARELEVACPVWDARALVRGFEDIRLIALPSHTGTGDELWGVANHPHPEVPHRRAMYLLRIDDPHGDAPRIAHAVHLHGWEDERHQKNWMPVVLAGALHLVYSCDPTVVLKPDTTTGRCELVSRQDPPFWCAELRGSSQLVSVHTATGRDAYLAVAHGVLGTAPRRSYFHALLRFDESLDIVGMSRPFLLRQPRIEFVAGCVRDRDDLVLTWGEEDASAWIGRVSVHDALQLCEPSMSWLPEEHPSVRLAT